MNAKFLSLNERDVIKGVVVTAFTSILTASLTYLNSGHVPNTADLKTIGIAGASAGISYLIKNLLTNSKDELGKVEPK
jgi:hypothetical protein